MNHLTRLVLAVFALFFVPNAEAELWRCRTARGSSTIVTSNPSSVGEHNCEPFVLRQGSFTQLPPEAALLQPVNKDLPAVADAEPLPRRPKPRPTVVWNFEELSSTKADKSFNSDEVQCRLWGSIKGVGAGVGKLTVHRGGATRDHFRLILPAAGKVQRWEFKVSGPCRNPLVRIIPFH